MLSEVRKLLGLTQRQLAEKVATTQNYYAVIESNPSRSSPVMRKVAAALKMTEQFLALGDNSRYPFRGDFYVFYLDEKRPFSGYSFLNTYICKESAFIDIVFFLRIPPIAAVSPEIVCFAIKDDHDTIFLLTGKTGRNPVGYNIEYVVPRVDFFRKDLYKSDILVYERTFVASDELYGKLRNKTIGREDVIGFFPNKKYFQRLYEAHKK